ncbi:g4702 [Coccomyxa viridis]|uniref:G4702 protein n=1 Tax=Coccomyxa viridis TaxID=1274662 RepID=A0ABP1FTL3_9CHLO
MSHRGSPLRGASTSVLPTSSPFARAGITGGRGKLLAASIGANVILAILLILWTGYNVTLQPQALRQASEQTRTSEVLLTRLKGDVQVLNGYLESAKRHMEEEISSSGTAANAADPYSVQQTSQEQPETQRQLSEVRERLNELVQQNSQLEARLNATEEEKVWLTVGIPTVPRKTGADYLTRTLETLLEELPADDTDPLYGRVRVLVMNNRPGNHSVFYALRERVQKGPAGDPFVAKARIYMALVDNPGTLPDPTPDAPDPDDFNNPTNRPGRQVEVRKQTCDLITLLEMAQPLSHYYLFMEDDFRVCPYAIRIMGYIVRKLNAVPSTAPWLAVRLSYGMNGILLPMRNLPSLTSYMRAHTARLPPDLLWLEWFQGRAQETWDTVRGHPLYVYHKNLLDHIGTHSSFAIRPDRLPFPQCFDSMAKVWSIHPLERFNAAACGHTDLFPCPPDNGAETWTHHHVVWPYQVDDAERDHPPLPPPAPHAASNASGNAAASAH